MRWEPLSLKEFKMKIYRLTLLIISFLFCIGGIVVIIVLPHVFRAEEARCTEKMTAVVTHCKEVHDDDGTSYEVSAEYVVDGNAYNAHTTFSTYYAVGYEFHGFYNPENPYEYYIDGFNPPPFVGVIVGIGMIFMGIMFFLTLALRSRRRR
jgi:hypothetical protein